jgi:hypothetical protein
MVNAKHHRALSRSIFAVLQCLKKLERVPTKAEAAKVLAPLASGGHLMPGDPGWPLGTLIPQPKSAADAGEQARADSARGAERGVV